MRCSCDVHNFRAVKKSVATSRDHALCWSMILSENRCPLVRGHARHVLPDSARVDHVEMAAASERDHLELVVIDQNDRDLALRQRLVDSQHLGAPFTQGFRKLAN